MTIDKGVKKRVYLYDSVDKELIQWDAQVSVLAKNDFKDHFRLFMHSLGVVPHHKENVVFKVLRLKRMQVNGRGNHAFESLNPAIAIFFRFSTI